MLAFAALMLVTVDARAADFTVSMTFDTFGNRAWMVNGQVNPTLTLTPGQTYTFDVNASGHPFDIKTQPVTGTADQFNTGVTGQGTMIGTLTFAVPASGTPPLFYQCEVHGTMSGVIQLAAPAAATPAVSAWSLALLALCLVAGGAMAMRLRQNAAA
jgi:hypothetical protein